MLLLVTHPRAKSDASDIAIPARVRLALDLNETPSLVIVLELESINGPMPGYLERLVSRTSATVPMLRRLNT